MSTNFYVRETSVNAATGQTVFEDTHVGLRAGGWTFMFQGQDITTLQGWRDFLSAMPSSMQVVDEYDNPYTVEEFWNLVDQTTKPWGPAGIPPRTQRFSGDRKTWIDGGFSFADCEFS